MTMELGIDKRFKEFIVIDRAHMNFMNSAHQWVFRFSNGYGASLVTGGPLTYGEYEMAVLEYTGKKDTEYSLTYDTSITNDVLGYLTLKNVEKYLEEISKLPPVERKEGEN